MQRLRSLLLITALSGTWALSSCAYEKAHRHPVHGWVTNDAWGSYDPLPEVVLPPDAPSIQQRFRPFSVADESGNFPGIHEGIDISGQVSDPVLAAADGVVTASRRSWAWGNEVRIAHGLDAKGREVHTLSVHLHERMVTAGERVRRGQQIGTMGITGMAAGDPPHLHFVVYARQARDRDGSWQPVNPHHYWADGVYRVTCYEADRAYPAEPLSLTYPVPCRRR